MDENNKMDTGNNNEDENKEESADEKAEEALMKVSTLGRDVPLEECHKLVLIILRSEKYAPMLPLLICHLRNHDKSLAPGQGSGERNVAERLTVVLYRIDQEIGRVLLRFLVVYGSWKSLTNILVLCDSLSNPQPVASQESSRKATKKKKAAADCGKGGLSASKTKKTDLKKNNSAASSGPYKDICGDVHDLFAEQLKQDKKSVEVESNEKKKKVSNASKYAPHEGRGRMLTSRHSDEIALKIFARDDYDGGDANDEKDSNIRMVGEKRKITAGAENGEQEQNKNKYHLRKLYRKLRSQLNEANDFLPDRKMTLGRAGEIETYQIPAGFFAKSRKALLNRTPSGKERYNTAGRRLLRQKVLKAATTPSRVPTPSDLNQLANDLAKVNVEDDEEVILLEASFEKAVLVVVNRIRELQKKLKNAMLTLSITEDDMYILELRDVVIGVDVSPSQAYTFPLVALLVILFHCVINKLKDEEKTEEGESDGKMTPLECFLFYKTTQTASLPVIGSVVERLRAMVEIFREARLTEDEREEDDYSGLLQKLKSNLEGSPHSTALVCSDFTSSPEFASAVKEHFDNSNLELVCWKMSQPVRTRNREIVSWDSDQPQIDLCICMDTTGSMGSHIDNCKREIRNLLSELSANGGMPVSCSFVSYKDFGNAGHLTTHEWVDASDFRRVESLQEYINLLTPSGGDDMEEDIAGGLESCIRLMEQRSDRSSLKLILIVADAPGHGYPHGRPNYGGVDQKERLRKAVIRLAAAPHAGGLGCELMLAEITTHTKPMCKAIDEILVPHSTFIDQFDLGYASRSVFKDKVVASIQQVVSHAVAPATAVGLDVISGSDIGICEQILTTRLSNRLQQLLEGKAGGGKEEDPSHNEESHERPIETRAMPTALGNLLGKLDSDDYDMVRYTMSTIKTGIYGSYETISNKGLSKASVRSLLVAGVTLADLEENGYPIHIQESFEEVTKEMLTKGSGRK